MSQRVSTGPNSIVNTFAKKGRVVINPQDAPPSDDPSWAADANGEPKPPSLEVSKARLTSRLPHKGGDESYGPRLVDFEKLGLGVYSYIAHLHRMRFFFMLLAMLSVSSLVANGYGGQLTDKQINVVTWLFTGASLGNANSIAPSYGATELLITTLMTLFLFYASYLLRQDAHRVEQKQVTPADFTVLISGLPRTLQAAPIQRALERAPEVQGKYVDIVVPLHQRELLLAHRALGQHDTKRDAYATDIKRLQAARQRAGTLSADGTTRLAKLEEAFKGAEATREKLLANAGAISATLPKGGPTSAGVAFVTFQDAHDAVDLLEQGAIALPDVGPAPFAVSRPPEPSDVIWENLGCTDGVSRQIRGTFYMLLLSSAGALLIGASAYLQPKAVESNKAASKSAVADLEVMVIGTVVLLVGYLSVFLSVPVVEVEFMRHTSVTQKEVSQVLKLVVFQIMATLSTIGSFAADTAGAFNRDWYITGGFMLVNGMFVDLFVISCVIQVRTISRPTSLAPHLPSPPRPRLALSRPLSPSLALSRPLPPSLALSHPLSPSLALSHPLPPSPALSRPLSPSLTLSHPPPPLVPPLVPPPGLGARNEHRPPPPRPQGPHPARHGSALRW